MKFSHHLDKGLWAFASKSLPAINGVAFVFLVVRFLPQEQYGAFVVVQTIFTFATALVNALAFLPLVKFASEKEDHGVYVIAAFVISSVFLAATVAGVVLFRDEFVGLVGGGPAAAELMVYLPFLFLTVYYRNFAVMLLQATYRLRRIFWIEAVYLLGTPLLILGTRLSGFFHSADDLFRIILVTQTCSSILAFFVTRGEMHLRFSFDRTALMEMWNFGKYTFGSTALYAAFAQLDVFFVSAAGGLAAVATYNASKVFTKVFDLISQVSQVFLVPYSSRRFASGDTQTLAVTAEKAIGFSLILLLPLGICMTVIPDVLLRLLYGAKYVDGVPIVRILGFMTIILPWNAVVASYVVGTGKVMQGLWSGILLVSMALPLYALLTPLFGAWGTSLGYVIAMACTSCYLVVFIRKFIPIGIPGVVGRWRDVREFVRELIRSRT